MYQDRTNKVPLTSGITKALHVLCTRIEPTKYHQLLESQKHYKQYTDASTLDRLGVILYKDQAVGEHSMETHHF